MGNDDGSVDGNENRELQLDEDVLDVDQRNENLPTSYDITSYGADYPVDGLVKRLDSGDIVVPSFEPSFEDDGDLAGFQRKFVWKRPQMDRFIESLLLGLPVPGIFLLRREDNKLLVLDGQQRLLTLKSFYSGNIGDVRYRLGDIKSSFADHTYEELEIGDRRRLDDSIIHATVLLQNTTDGSQNAVYSIFERLNTGGSALQPQEIRVALYPGAFLRALSKINISKSWRILYGKKQSARLKDHELILRVFALYEGTIKYERPLKGYLNDYLGKNQYRVVDSSAPLWKTFETAMDLIATYIGPNAFRPVRSVNAAVLDSIAVAMMRRVTVGSIENPAELKAAYDDLLLNADYKVAIESSTAGEESVKTRIARATEAFAGVK